ncbi:WAP four-disulfide core domain protein 13 isoform X2 [Nycticebus coucang]|uniref:WAP four-disulfide core domain protein 13 isoform X2 n=1 Tax=Nycticebus coucang TaxID=9470 RepID=UPI00234D3855|nr:WAP four-disulfide core domain protein 13 isoform X2 [Nycticebus coucang]XP_053429981.1 WAP four-disulfide core domain protein 13 isoform X2 [Nycticebus coucang]XP_053429982.1 WAP four-disulfide core domain protein 13 isoform X2 [Nycticebus coucang]
MKPVQLLLVVSLVLQLVPGSPKPRFLKYILEPPPCRSDPENCTQFCTLQEDCQKGLQCCSAFCGIICSTNQMPKRHKKKQKHLEITTRNN